MIKTIQGDNYILHLGDCRELLSEIGSGVSLVADPPYGIDLKTDYKSGKRGSLAECNDFAPIAGDSQPFDPSPFLRFGEIVLFGANYYADKLPVSSGWIIWDKLDGLESSRELGFNDNADCELAWTNKPVPARIVRHRWMGAMKASEQTQRRIHPTQKPVALMQLIIRHYTTGTVIFDPFMGSGSIGVAALREGRQFVGVELEESYFADAHARIAGAAGDMVLTRRERDSGQLSLF